MEKLTTAANGQWTLKEGALGEPAAKGEVVQLAGRTPKVDAAVKAPGDAPAKILPMAQATAGQVKTQIAGSRTPKALPEGSAVARAGASPSSADKVRAWLKDRITRNTAKKV